MSCMNVLYIYVYFLYAIVKNITQIFIKKITYYSNIYEGFGPGGL